MQLKFEKKITSVKEIGKSGYLLFHKLMTPLFYLYHYLMSIFFFFSFLFHYDF